MPMTQWTIETANRFSTGRISGRFQIDFDPREFQQACEALELFFQLLSALHHTEKEVEEIKLQIQQRLNKAEQDTYRVS